MDTTLNIGKDTVPRKKHILTPIWEPTSRPPFIDPTRWHTKCQSSICHIQYQYDGYATAIIQGGHKYFAVRSAANLPTCHQQRQANNHENGSQSQ